MINITLSNRIRPISLSGLIEQEKLMVKTMLYIQIDQKYFSIIFLGQSK